MAYYNHQWSLHRRLSLVADIALGWRVGFVELRSIVFLPVQKGQFDGAMFPFTQMVGYATTTLLAANTKALFYQKLEVAY